MSRCCTRSTTACARSRSTTRSVATRGTPTWSRQYFDALDRAAADDDVRAIVVTGAGRSFCPGLDSATARAGGRAGRAAPRRPALAALRARRSQADDRRDQRRVRRDRAGPGARVRRAVHGPRRCGCRPPTPSSVCPPSTGCRGCSPRMIGVEWALDLLLVVAAGRRRGGAAHRPGDPGVRRRRSARRGAGVRRRCSARGSSPDLDGDDPPPGVGRPQPALHRGQRGSGSRRWCA